MKSSRLLSEASMLKKEINDVLRHNFFFILFILFLPAFLVVTKILPNQSYFSVFFPLFQFGLLFWAFFMGISLFSVEHGQRGMEYLLSLPLSRYKLIGLKILPRFIAILIFYVIFLILYLGEGSNYAALSLVAFTTIYFSFYLISLSFSASSDNFLVLFVVSLLSLFIFLALGYSVYWLTVKMKGYIYYVVRISPFITDDLESFIVILIPLVAFCLLIPLLIAFVLSVKKFDIRPSRVFNTRFIKIFAPLFILGLLASFLISHQLVDVEYSSYYLTRDHKLIEFNDYFGFRIYDGKNVHKIQDRFYSFYPAVEDNQYVYSTTYGGKILRIDTSDYSVDIIYEAPKGKSFMWGSYLLQLGGLQNDERTIALLERNRDYSDRMLVLLVLVDESLKEIKRIPLDTSPVKGFYSLMIFATDQSDGNRYWLATAWKHDKGTSIFRVWEDGRVERLGSTRKFPFYINGLLFTYSEKEIIVSREKNGRFEEIRRIPNQKDYLFGYGYWKADLSNTQVKEIFGRKYRPKEEWKKGPMWAKLDLETFKIEELSDAKKWLYYFGPDECYFEDKDYEAGTLAIYRYQDGRSTLIRSFRCSFEKTFYPYGIFEGGIVLEKGKKVKVYAFPDLKEIKFKKL
jgi:hypothetical protein